VKKTMTKVLEPIKGFIGLMVAAPIAGAAIGAVGNIGTGMSSGMKGATQSMIGLGLFSNAASLFKIK